MSNHKESKSEVFLSIVSPVYAAESLVEPLVNQLRQVLEEMGITYEIILVNDGSPDNCWIVIERVCQEDQRIIGVNLSRNFGQHNAITAGLRQCRGEWVVVMDCDLQDQPSEIPSLLKKAQEGVLVVRARRVNRRDNWMKKTASKAFHFILSYLSGVKHDAAIANFGIYHWKVIHTIRSMPESFRYFPTMVKWVGFSQTTLEVMHAARGSGKTSYNFKRMFDLALDVCLSYSDKPLRLVVKTGCSISALGFIAAFYALFRFFQGDFSAEEYPVLLISVWLLSGILITMLGVVGLYVGKVFEGVKQRPCYIVDEVLNG